MSEYILSEVSMLNVTLKTVSVNVEFAKCMHTWTR